MELSEKNTARKVWHDLWYNNEEGLEEFESLIEYLADQYQKSWYDNEMNLIKRIIIDSNLNYPIKNSDNLGSLKENLSRYEFDWSIPFNDDIINPMELFEYLKRNGIKRIKNGENILKPSNTGFNTANIEENRRAAIVVCKIIRFLDSLGISFKALGNPLVEKSLLLLIGTIIHLEWLKNAIKNQGGYPVGTEQCLQYSMLSAILKGKDIEQASLDVLNCFRNKNEAIFLVSAILKNPENIADAISKAEYSSLSNLLQERFPNFAKNEEKSMTLEQSSAIEELLLVVRILELEFICEYTTIFEFPAGMSENEKYTILNRSYNSLCPPNGKIYAILYNRENDNNKKTEDEKRKSVSASIEEYIELLKTTTTAAGCSFDEVLDYHEQQIEELAAAEVRKRMLDEYDREYLEDGVTNISRFK